MKEVVPISDEDRRAKLRQVFTLLEEIDIGMPFEDFADESLSIETATDALKQGFGKDYLSTCEGCSVVLMVGDEGQRCVDGEHLCKECAASWGDIKMQWDDDALDEDEPGDKARFLARYDAHIAAGGSPDDLLTYPL